MKEKDKLELFESGIEAKDKPKISKLKIGGQYAIYFNQGMAIQRLGKRRNSMEIQFRL